MNPRRVGAVVAVVAVVGLVVALVACVPGPESRLKVTYEVDGAEKTVTVSPDDIT